jgi:Tol biopolymer transport system component
MIGKTLGHYEILERIGAGGMGEVYRARDTRLDRTVAIKILPSHFSGDPELKQRFEREAHVISNLSHPHICTLYDVGHEAGIDFLVMEYLEGESLAERLGKGALSAHEVMRCGAEIAEALDRAHRSGVVHRDLKPGNVMLTRDGVKLLDFGLAKARVDEATSDATSSDATDGPTRLASQPGAHDPLTEKGTVLGTFRYMAPEQLEGREADVRTDIFALGAVLYEMATGSRAFDGSSQASLIAAIMSQDPEPISAVEPMTPPALDWTVRKCLAKDPEDRWQSSADVADALRWIAEDSSRAGVVLPVTSPRRTRGRLVWGLAGVCVGAVLAALAFTIVRPHRPPALTGSIRFEIAPPEAITSIGWPRVSPDGRYIAFDATDAHGFNRLWLRCLDEAVVRPLPGTEGAWRPFWSPDSRFVAFFTEGKLKRVEIPDGPTLTVCDAPGAADGALGPEGIALYDGGPGDSIRCISPGGEAPRAATIIDRSRGEMSHMWPQFLPDGRHFLFLASGRSPTAGDRSLKVGTLDSDLVKIVAASESRAEFALPGYLLFVRGGHLVAQRFSLSSFQLSGDPHVVVHDLGCSGPGLSYFSVSDNGILVYRHSSPPMSQLVWVDREGHELSTVGEPAALAHPWLSPDEKHVAVEVIDPASRTEDIWVMSPTRGTTTRLTFDSTEDSYPLWSPDGREIAFASGRSGVGFDLYKKSADGTGETEPILVLGTPVWPTDWSPDGQHIACETWVSDTMWDIVMVSMGEGRESFGFLQTPFGEFQARFSPDGRFVAYASNETGRWEVYVRSFSGSGGKWHISSGGGTDPQWRGDGKELFYLDPDRVLMSVGVTEDPRFAASAPEPLFAAPVVTTILARNRYAASADGQRFLLVSPLVADSRAAISVVTNWAEGLPLE